MSRDENNKLKFGLGDVGIIVSLILGMGSIIGTIGGWKVIEYRVDQNEKATARLENLQKDFSLELKTRMMKDSEQDKLLQAVAQDLTRLVDTTKEINQKLDKKIQTDTDRDKTRLEKLEQFERKFGGGSP